MKSIRGVSRSTRKGVDYWYAQLDRKTYFGTGQEGYEMAEAARASYVKEQWEKKQEQRGKVAGLKVKRAKLRTIKELANYYCLDTDVQELKSYGRRVAAAAHLLEYFGRTPLSRVGMKEQKAYRKHRRSQGAMDGTVDYEMLTLSAMYSLALEDEMIQIDMRPVKFICKGETNPRRLVTDEEFEKILEQVKDQDFKDFLVAGWESAMRSAEIANLRAKQVHLDVHHQPMSDKVTELSPETLDYISLGKFGTKTQTPRTVPVSPRLKKILIRRLNGLKPEDKVFEYQKNGIAKTWRGNRVAYRLSRVCEKAGIPYGDKTLDEDGERVGIVFHCFRHTRISKWVEMGFSDEIVRRASGHANLKSYQRYVKLGPAVVMRLVAVDNFGTKTPETLASQASG